MNTDWVKLENFFPTYPLPTDNPPELFNYYDNKKYYLTNMLKKEFRVLALDKSEMKPKKGVPLKHQDFVRKFIAPVTDNNKLLIFHGLGTGKTCLAVYAYEFAKEFFDEDTSQSSDDKREIKNDEIEQNIELDAETRNKPKLKKALVIVRGPNSKKNFVRELAMVCTDGDYIPKNEEVIEKKDGKITRKYIKLSAEKRYLRMNKLVKKNYSVNTFIKFATELSKLSDEFIKKEYSNSYIIIDEVHNLRYQPREATVTLYDQYHRLLHLAENTKVLLLTATPMRDRPDEIVSIMNLLLPLDKQISLKTFRTDFLDIDQNLKSSMVPRLQNLFYGLISYVRSMESTVKKDFEGKVYTPFMKKIFTVNHIMKDTQKDAYQEFWKQEASSQEDVDSIDDLDDDDEEQKGDGLYENSRQASLFVFPDKETGKQALAAKKWFFLDKSNNGHLTNEMKVLLDKNVSFENPQKTLQDRLKNLEKYSSKYAYIIREIFAHPKEKVFIYSSFVKGSGALLIGALLEYFGMNSLNTTGLFGRETSITDEETLEEKSTETDPNQDIIQSITQNNNRFVTITGSTLSPFVADNVISKIFNHPANKYGDYLRVIIGSHVVGEGLSFKCVRQLHVATPHWNNSVTEQVIGRGIRAFSHDDLLQQDRYIKIYRHASVVSDSNLKDSIDMKMYKLSESKDIKIKMIERVMKESAVDCYINRGRNIRPDIDQDDSRACDYTSCDYKCAFLPNDIENYDLIDDTNNLYYDEKDVQEIIARLLQFFESRYSADLTEILSMFQDKTIIIVIRSLLKMIDDKVPIRTIYGNICYLREDNNLYFLVDRVDRPNNFLLSGYTILPVVKTEKNISNVIKSKEPELINKYIEELSELSLKKNSERIYFIFIKIFSPLVREYFLEQYFLANKLNISKQESIRKEFLDFYGKYIFKVKDSYFSFYMFKRGGKLRVLTENDIENAFEKYTEDNNLTFSDLGWSDADDNQIEIFEKYRNRFRKRLDRNEFGYYAVLSERVDDEKYNQMGLFKYKIYKVLEDVRVTTGGVTDKRVAREFNPGTECGTGAFDRKGVVEMLSRIIYTLYKNDESDKYPTFEVESNVETIEKLKKMDLYDNLYSEILENIDELDDKDFINTLAKLLKSDRKDLCNISREWFEENDLVWMI